MGMMDEAWEGEGFEQSYQEEFDSSESTPPAQAQQPTRRRPTLPVPAERVEDELSEVDRRLTDAQYLRQLTNVDLFHDGSESASRISAMLRAWAFEQMESLLGMRAPAAPASAPSDFSAEEVLVLKKVAGRFLAGSPQEAPKAPKAPPVPRLSVPPPPKPIIQPRPAQKPPVASKPVPGSSRRVARPAPNVSAADKPLDELRGDFDQVMAERVRSLSPGEVFEEDGKTWKVVERPDNGEKSAVIVHKQVRSPTAMPMPTGSAMARATAASSGEGEAFAGQRAASTMGLIRGLFRK